MRTEVQLPGLWIDSLLPAPSKGWTFQHPLGGLLDQLGEIGADLEWGSDASISFATPKTGMAALGKPKYIRHLET